MKRFGKWLLLPFLIACFNEGVHFMNGMTQQGPSSREEIAQPKETTVSSKMVKESSIRIDERAIPIDQSQYNELAALTVDSSQKPIQPVNQNKSTLDPSKWQTEYVFYGDLDALNRTTCVTAYLSQRNLGRSKGRERQVWKPTGWHQKRVNGEAIYNRGHLLAYTSSFNFDQDGNFKEGENGSIDNPKNLATQTAYANQKLQTYYETLVRDAQKRAGNHVIYQIVTVFRGNELMPRGYWLQAKDSQGTLDFNVYEFNIQPHVTFDYATGASQITH